LTGEHDDEHIASDAHSRESMQEWCVFNSVTQIEPRRWHELAAASTFKSSLDVLVKPLHSDPDRLAECRTHVEEGLNARLKEVEDALARGDRKSADRLLGKLDERYGGLAAPRSLELLRVPDAGEPSIKRAQ
jgi:hypothetical protein